MPPDQQKTLLALIVDDDAVDRLMARAALESSGWNVEEAENGREALAIFQRLHPDVVLLDIMMPEMDGFTVCAALRQLPEGEHTPILIMTGQEDYNSIMQAYDAGATDFLTKPLNGLLLTHRVRYIVRSSRALQDLRTSQVSLAQSERRLRFTQFAVDHAEDGILWVDDSKRFMYANEAACRLMGYANEELLTLSISDIAPYLARYQQRIDQIKEGTAATYESVHRRKDGTEFPIEASVTILKHEGQNYICAIIRDITERKHIEEERLQALVAIENIMETAPDIMFTLDIQGNMVKWNRRVRDVTGYSPEELLNKPAWAFVPPEEQPRTAAAIQQAFTEGYAELEGHLLTKEHRLIPYHWTGALLKNPHGEPIGITGIGRDVSDKKRTEEELQSQRRHLVDAQAIAHLGSWGWDIDTGEVQWSDEQFRIFGHEPGSIHVMYDTFLAALLPDDHDRVLAAINDALVGKLSYEIEYRIVRPNGEVRSIHARGDVHRDATGHPLSMAGTVLDITERKQDEESLRVSEERWQLAVRGSNDGIWDWNIQTGEVYFSARWKAMRGYEESELANSISEWQSRIHPDDLERVLQRIDQYLAKQRPEYCEEYRVEQKDGSYKWALDRGMALWADDGTPLRMAGSESDITGHRQAILHLAEQGSLLRAILDTEPECVKRVAADGTLLQMNNAGLCFIETDSFQQVAGRSVYDLVAPEFLELYRSMHKAVIQGASQQFEFQIVGLKGTRRWMETHAVPLQNPIDGTVEQLAITRDITERKQTETALRASEERFRTLAEETTDWMWEINEQGRYTYCSPKIRDLLGYEPDEAIEKTPFDFMPEGEASRVANLLGPIAAARKPFAGIEHTNRHKDGRLVVFECRGVPIIDANGVFRGYRGFDQDITERKWAEEALRHSERQLRTVLDALPLGVWFTDRSGKPILANPAAKQIWSNIKQIGLQTTNNQSGWWETIGPANEPHRWALSEALTTGVPSLNETFDLECLDGTKKVIRNSTVPVQDEAGVILGAIVLNEDITMLRKAQAALQLTQFSVDHVVEGFFWIGPDARIFHVNDAACRMLEYTREELMTMTVYDIDPNFLPEVWPAYWEELKQKESLTFESKQWSRTGRVMDTEINVKYLQYEGKEYNCAIMRDIGERKRAEAALRTSEEQFRTMFTQAPIGMALIDSLTGKIHEVNTEYAQIVGRTTEEMRSLDWISITHPDDVQADLDNMARLNAGEIAGFKMEKRYVRPDGTVAWVNLTVAPIQIEQHAGTCHLAMIEDITKRKVNEQFLAGEKRILEMIATDVPLQEVLTLVCQVVEAHSHRAHCSILLLDPDGLHLRHGAAPSLPEAYVHAVDGLAIGPTVGSCGTAVFTRCQVIVSDIARDPLWADFRDLALRHGLLACWSTPVIASDGTVLGAFAVYYGKPQLPTDADFRLIERAVYIACIAIERRQAVQEQYRLIENLTRSQQHFQALFNWTPSAVGISTVAEGRFCDVNEGFSRLTGYAREEVIGRKTLDLGLWADPSDRAIVFREIREQGYLHNREGLLRTKSGEIRSLMVSVDSIQLGSTPCLIYLAHDITERKRAEEALRLAKFSMDRAADAVYWIDPQAKVLDVNEAASLMLGYSKDELCSMTVHDLNPDFQPDMWPGFWTETKRRGTMVVEAAHRAKNGCLIPIEVSVNYLSYEGKEYHCAFVRNITDRKRAEEVLHQRERDLRIAIEERERISQDLHDGILQSLFAVGLTLETTKSLMSPGSRKISGPPLNQAIEQLNRVMHEIRNFIAGLGSDLLQGKDLPTALQHMLASLTENQATRVRLAVEDRAAKAVSAEQSLHLFLVIQEAVSNCIQHGRAPEARVSLKMLKQGVRLSIRDDGRGFNPETAKGSGHGLSNMAARAQKIGGRFTVLSKVNEGTRIVLDLPKEASYGRR